MAKWFKMVVLEALLEADALFSGLPLTDLARRSRALLARSPELSADLVGVRELPDPREPDERSWLAYWRKNPIDHWTGKGVAGAAKPSSRSRAIASSPASRTPPATRRRAQPWSR